MTCRLILHRKVELQFYRLFSLSRAYSFSLLEATTCLMLPQRHQLCGQPHRNLGLILVRATRLALLQTN